MTRSGARPLLAAAVGALAAVALAACGGGATAPSRSASATTAATTTTATPRVVTVTADAPPYDKDAAAKFGDTNVVDAYNEVVQTASAYAFNPTCFLGYPRHLQADVLSPLYARMTPTEVANVRKEAAACLDDNNPQQLQQCYDVEMLAYFNIGNSVDRYAYMPDGTFVTDHTITNPKVWIDTTNPNRLIFSFDEEAHLRVLRAGEPVVGDMKRSVEYALVRAPQGNSLKWLIDDSQGKGTGSLVDAKTGQPVTEPSTSASASASA